MQNILVSSIAILLYIFRGTNGDYYWREYNMEIPSDAVLGISGYYIALAAGSGSSNSFAVAPTRIQPGDTSVYLPTVETSIRVEDGIKILCSSNKNNFTWVRTSTATFLVDLEGRRLVYGGVQGDASGNKENRYLNYIGRDGDYIGKVVVRKFLFYYADETKENVSTDYYVLTY